jgi:hypothetical protein
MSTSNSSDGADHGTASTQFVIGRNVRGGEYGAEPSLAKFDRNRRLLASLDFRSLYGSIVDGWLGGGGSTIVNGTFEDLGLFHGPPGSSPSIPGVPVATARVVPRALVAPGGFVPMTPVRVFDTRDGTGGRRSPLGPGEKWEFTFGPEVGVAANATAVAVNVTSVDATRRSFITAWPAGEMRPFTANLNPVPGKAVPNLVVATLGGGGAVSLFNYDGNVHLVGDLVGFFSPTAPGGVAPLVPARLLDTRDGTGGVGGPVGAGQSIDLQVTGRGRARRATSPSGRRASRAHWRRVSTWCAGRPSRTWCSRGSGRTAGSVSTTTRGRRTSSPTSSARSATRTRVGSCR